MIVYNNRRNDKNIKNIIIRFSIDEIKNCPVVRHHSGDLFLFFQKEIRREKICIGIGIGLLLIALCLVHLTD